MNADKMFLTRAEDKVLQVYQDENCCWFVGYETRTRSIRKFSGKGSKRFSEKEQAQAYLNRYAREKNLKRYYGE